MLLVAVLSIFSIVACTSSDMQGRTSGLSDDGRQQLLALGSDGATLTTTLSNTTYKSWDKLHGMQVEFLSDSGQAFLWYPRNTRLVVGEWETRDFDSANSPSICFRFSNNTINPGLGTRGGHWTCRHGRGFVRQANEIVRDDIFNLSTGEIPFVLPADKDLSFNAILRMARLQAPLEYVWNY